MSEHDTSMDQNDIAAQKSSKSFVPQSDDEETLWSVHEITQESDTQYKVRWVGTDPQTGKPWAQSWVPKSDCTDDLVLKWGAKKKPNRHNAVGQLLPNPKRKRQLEEDMVESTEVLDEPSVKTKKAKPRKKQKEEEVDEEDAPVNVPLLDTRSSLKVGPPRGVRKSHPKAQYSQPFSCSPAPSLRSNGDGAKATDKTEEVPANCPSEQKLSIAKRQPLCSPESSDAEGTSPNRGTAVGKPGPSERTLGEYKVQFASIAANILTLQGLVKKVDVQLETAMKELRELEVSWPLVQKHL